MTVSRRRFLGASAAGAAAVTLIPNFAVAESFSPVTDTLDDGAIYALGRKGVDAALAAGATYADVRFSVTRARRFMNGPPGLDAMEYGVGIRVLFNGYWGFYSSVNFTEAEMVRLAKGAVAQATAFSRGRKDVVELAPVAKVVNGDWKMPIKYDPFEVPIGEQLDVIYSYVDYVGQQMYGVGASWVIDYSRTTFYFCSSEGSNWKQTSYKTGAGFSISYRDQYSKELGPGGYGVDIMSTAGMGWERISECNFAAQVPKFIEEAEQSRYGIPVDVNRYEAVLAPAAIANLLGQTIGGATQLDRALGYEANAGGTSYINEPFEMLGNFKVGGPNVNVVAGRSEAGLLATRKWDDEGVEVKDFTLVKDGILNDFQTNREHAGTLADTYKALGRSVESNACSGSASAREIALQMTPNLTLVGDPNGPTFEEMVKGVERGVAVMSLSASVDQQFLNGVGNGTFREIIKGKLGKYLWGAGTIFRTPEIWTGIKTLGRSSASESVGMGRGKGQPYQYWNFSVTAPPVHLKQLDIIDIKRKA